MALGQNGGEELQPFAGGHENPHVAVAKNVNHLFGFQEWVDRNKNAPYGSRGEQGNYRFLAFLQVYGDTLAPVEPQRNHAIASPFHLGRQCLVCQPFSLIYERLLFGSALRRSGNKLMDKIYH
jgi:hypothetical protein